eukprot:3354274-Prymnesium_polylepis.1
MAAMPDDGTNPYIYPALLLPLRASQTDRVETDREHGEPDIMHLRPRGSRPRAAARGRQPLGLRRGRA